jgi:hypothetical protein
MVWLELRNSQMVHASFVVVTITLFCPRTWLVTVPDSSYMTCHRTWLVTVHDVSPYMTPRTWLVTVHDSSYMTCHRTGLLVHDLLPYMTPRTWLITVHDLSPRFPYMSNLTGATNWTRVLPIRSYHVTQEFCGFHGVSCCSIFSFPCTVLWTFFLSI